GLEEPVEAPLPDGVTAAAKATNPTEQVATATPRVTLSLGGAEGHLRQRIELDPENWALHRQLGEVLLDAGDRAAGLDSLERAMSGFESAGKLEDANEVADVILRVHPNSIRHHQKRVEYAVRLKDRARLATAYLELGDALFRTGEGDKSIAVYSRVAELDPDNERALFALATLAPERVEALRGKPARRDRWSDELEALPESLATLPLSSAPPERTRAAPKPVAERPDVEDEPEPYEADQASWGEGPALVEHAAASADDTAGTPLEVPEGFESTSLAFEAEIPEEEIRRQDSLTPPSPEPISDQSSASAPEAPLDFLPLVEDLLAPEELDEVTAAPPPPPEPPAPEHEAPDTILPIEAFAPPAAPPAEVSPPLAAAPPKPAREVEPPRPPAPRPAAPEPSSTSDAAGEYIDLGDWLRDSEAPRSTRMVVEDARPTGDEQADFEELLRRFKRGLAENVDEEDFEAHYDLGVAFKEMGLVDEAIAEFQKALRGSTHRIKAYEALGACFVEKSQYPIAAALLQRAIELPGTDDQQLVGVLYLLGFASEQLGRHADALRYYQRVFAVDIDFRDVRQRVSAMEHLTK
ncbi:MAG TPA: tetratricopeptide repeat protein, partial [Gemmatimonadaceae bacterium]